MKNYHHEGELAPRDIVSRAKIQKWLKLKAAMCIFDMTHLEKILSENGSPLNLFYMPSDNIDITSGLNPVSPAAHYIMEE